MKSELAIRILEISEDLGFVANTIVGYRAREVRGYVEELAKLAAQAEESTR